MNEKNNRVNKKIDNKDLGQFVENMLDGFALCKIICNNRGHPVDWLYLYVNKRHSKLTGLKNVTGKTVSEAVPGVLKEHPEIIEKYGKVALTRKSSEWNEQIRILGKNLFFRVSSFSPKRGFFISIFNDISQSQKDLKMANEYANALLDVIPGPLLILNTDLKILSANASFYETFKVNKNKTTNCFVYDLGNGQWNIPELRKLLNELLPKKKVITDFEVRHNFQTIGEKIMLLNARQLDAHQLIILTFQDITKLEEEERETRIMEEKFRELSSYTRTLIESSLDPLVTINAEGKVTDANKAAAKIRGVSIKELIGSNFAKYFTEPEKAQEVVKKAFARGYASGFPLTFKNRNGKLTNVLYNASAYRNEKGNVVGVFGSARDITELKKAEDSLKEHTEEVEKLNKIMVGRELKMVELKQEIAKLKTMLAQKQPDEKIAPA
jgi:PAS domain S-box-containing protein